MHCAVGPVGVQQEIDSITNELKTTLSRLKNLMVRVSDKDKMNAPNASVQIWQFWNELNAFVEENNQRQQLITLALAAVSC